MTATSLTLARHLAAQGFCVIPLLRGGKKPAVRWKRFQTQRPSDSELVAWFAAGEWEPAIVTGAISGITVIDCDSLDAIAACEARAIRSILTQRTSRGLHLVFRHGGDRNTVRLDGLAGVDRRGEGGFVRAYPDSLSWTRAAVEAADVAPRPAGASAGNRPARRASTPAPRSECFWPPIRAGVAR
jgi:hypothetical protein